MARQKIRRFVCVFALVAVAASAGEPPPHVAIKPERRTDVEFTERFFEINAASKKGEAQLVFLGDSITDMWTWDDAGKPVWEKYWAPLKASNFGIRGDRTEHVLWRLDNGNFDGLSPKLIVLMIGTNNAGQQQEDKSYKCTAPQTADGIKAILTKLKTKCPSAKVLLLAIFPRGEEETDVVRKQNDATNAIIKTFADDKTVLFLDIGKSFLKPNGDGDVTIMPDMLHLSTKGYTIWAEAIQAKVKELIK
jgi:lysophospholipase L1-like esterase